MKHHTYITLRANIYLQHLALPPLPALAYLTDEKQARQTSLCLPKFGHPILCFHPHSASSLLIASGTWLPDRVDAPIDNYRRRKRCSCTV